MSLAMLLYPRGQTCPPRPPRCRIFKDWQIKGNLVVQSHQLSGVQSGGSLHQFLGRSSAFPVLPLAFCVYVVWVCLLGVTGTLQTRLT